MAKTFNGRPQKLGGMYFIKHENGTSTRKFCIGYCEKCGAKFGLTSWDLKEFAENMPGFIPDFVQRLFRLRIIVPK